MIVTFANNVWNHGVNVEVAMGPDADGAPLPAYPRQFKRMNANSTWEVTAPDGYDVWYHRDSSPDHPTIPPSYDASWDHIANFGDDKNVDL